MLYLAQLLSIYDGNTPDRWGYSFTRSCFGAPLSSEIIAEIEFLCSKGLIKKDENSFYYVTGDVRNSLMKRIELSDYLGWRTSYILAALDSLLTKSFPKVVSSIQFDPAIVELEILDRTSVLLNEATLRTLYDDFETLKSISGTNGRNLLITASLWIDYLGLLAQKEKKDDR